MVKYWYFIKMFTIYEYLNAYCVTLHQNVKILMQRHAKIM